MAEGVAGCAVHAERAWVCTCSRCGRFCCEACAQSRPCLECQLLQRENCPSLQPFWDLLIGLFATAFAACSVAYIVFATQLSAAGQEAGSFGFSLSTVMELVSQLAALGFYAAWLGWFLTLHDWAAARGVAVPHKLFSAACAFTCGVNFIQPFVTLVRIRRHSGVETPLVGWWAPVWGHALLSMRGGLSTEGEPGESTVAAAMSALAMLLAWKVARDFRLADRAWDPRAQLAARP